MSKLTGSPIGRWEGIDEFVETVQAGSFTGAAENLGVSKSYVSKQVRKLEARLDARLLQRTTRQLTLTDVGQVFFEHCREISNHYERLESAIADMQKKPKGTLRIAINSRFGVQHMAGAVAAFSQLHPDLAVEVHSSFRDVDLIAEGFDLNIRYGELEDSTLVARRIGSYTMSLCASPGYWKSRGRPRSLSELADHNCLCVPERYWVFDSVDKKPVKIKIDGNWISEDGATLLAAAQESIGIAQLPDFFIRNAVESGALSKLRTTWSSYERVVWAVYPGNQHLSAKVRFFIDFLRNYTENVLSPRFKLFINDNSVP